MDSATKIDDVLYEKEKSRIVTRIIEFCIFGFLNLWLIRLTLTLFSTTALLLVVIPMLRIMFWVNIGLLVVVIVSAWCLLITDF